MDWNFCRNVANSRPDCVIRPTISSNPSQHHESQRPTLDSISEKGGNPLQKKLTRRPQKILPKNNKNLP